MTTQTQTIEHHSTNPTGAALEARDVVVRFGGVTALAAVSVAVRPGEVLGLIGPNGAGKTTLFDVLSGIQPPTSGSVWLNGADVTGRNATWRSRRGLRRTFQRQQAFGWLTVEENVLIAVEWRRNSVIGDMLRAPLARGEQARLRQRAREVIGECGLDEVRDVVAGRLPIGLIRMVELARAVADRPDVLLLDEPTSGLNEREVEDFAQVMHATAASNGCAVALVEHDVPFVMSNCDRITVLDLGSVIADGTPDEIARNQVVRTAYLG